MVSAALGTQVIGSTIRPASYCGAYGFKPTVNALNREGCHDYQSQSCTGIIAATLEDTWQVAHEIVDARRRRRRHAGPGRPCHAALPRRSRSGSRSWRPPGWATPSPAAQAIMQEALQRLKGAGIAIADAPRRCRRSQRSKTTSPARTRCRTRSTAGRRAGSCAAPANAMRSKLSKVMQTRLAGERGADARRLSRRADRARAHPRALCRARRRRTTAASRCPRTGGAPKGLQSTGNAAVRGAELAARRPGADAAAVRDRRHAARPAGARLLQRGRRAPSRSPAGCATSSAVHERLMDDRTSQKLHAALERYRRRRAGERAQLSRPARARAGAGARGPAGRRRRADQQRHRDASAGALAVSRRHRGAGPQGVPVHAADRLQRPPLRRRRAGRRASPPTARSIAPASASRWRRSARAWVNAIANPIPPRVVENAPCQEIVITGADLDKDGQALDGLPVPISTPGWDNAPYLSAGHYITKDPDTGVQNVGNYRGQLKAPQAARHEPVGRAARRHLRALGEIQGARRAAALRGRGRLPAGRLLCVGAEARQRSRRACGRRRDRRRADQRRALQDRRPAGAGGSRDRDRGPDQHRAAGAGSAVRRIPRLRQSAGIQRLHGRHRDHAAAQSDPHLVHQPGDAERVERDPPRRDGAGAPALSANRCCRSAASSAWRCTSRSPASMR